MSVQDYLDKHMLSRKIEDAVNAAVRAKTADPVLFIYYVYMDEELWRD
ncbi:putative phosphopyruvate hydratase [Helianthus annuus]|nr:putative phosphopyruvate hydratase [Helianthus annuus]